MNKRYIISLLAVIVLFLLAYVGASAVPATRWVFGVWIPYAAVLVFIVFFIRRIMAWARVPVPFHIPTTAGQQKSLPWIRHAKWDNPFSKSGVFMRMLLEVAAFRSLFRNTRMKLRQGRVSYSLEIFLWVGALAFHYAFFAVLFRHLRFFTEPVPLPVRLVENIDSFFRLEVLRDTVQIGVPGVYLSGLVLL
ncbi:MAG: menaquinol oxidoreductase, partial [Desulfobacterales bacterium]